MIIIKALEDIDWNWCKCKKDQYVSVPDAHRRFLLENRDKIEVLGQFKSLMRNGKIPSIMNRETLAKEMRFLELSASTNLESIRSFMKNLKISPFMQIGEVTDGKSRD